MEYWEYKQIMGKLDTILEGQKASVVESSGLLDSALRIQSEIKAARKATTNETQGDIDEESILHGAELSARSLVTDLRRLSKAKESNDKASRCRASNLSN